MYIEIQDLTQEEKDILTKMFGDRARFIYSVYHEVCRIEADCSIERVIDELAIELTQEDLNTAMDEIADDIANACEDRAFQEMCEIADEVTRNYFA